MFSDSDRAFMSDNMKIVVESIESKLREPLISEFSEIAYESISKYIDAIKNMKYLVQLEIYIFAKIMRLKNLLKTTSVR